MRVRIVLAPTVTELVRYIARLPEEGKTVIFCEDRLTLEAERAVAAEKGVTFDTSVTTFARFLKSARGAKVLSKQGSVLTVGSIAAANADKLRCFGKNPAGAAGRLYETIAQLRAALVTPEMLESSASEVEGNLSEKLADIALVYREYLDFLARGYLDESGVLALLPEAMEGKDGVKGAHAVFAGFTSFTKQAAAGIFAALRAAKSVTGVFLGGKEGAYTMEAANAFEKYCKEGGAVCEYEYLPSLLPPEADRFRRGVFDPVASEPTETGAVRLYEGADAEDELSFVAAMIKKEVTDNGLRYRDIALLLSDPKEYAVTLEKIFSEYNIPYFSDVRKSAAFHPLCKFLVGWLRVLSEGFAPEEVLSFIGNPFFGEGEEARDIYRNYLLRYANYRGGVKKPIAVSAGSDTILLTSLREKLLSSFEGAGGSATAAQYCGFLRALMRAFGAEDTQKALSRRFSDAGMRAESEFLSRGTEICDRVLSEAELLSSERPLRAEEFAALLFESFSSTEVSLIPQTVDAVFVGSLAESKKPASKVLFAARLTSDVPPAGMDTALISDRDIDRLRALKVEIQPKIREVNARAAENVALSLAGFTQRIYLSYPLSAGGKECKKSEVIDFARSAFTLGGKPLGILTRGALERSERFSAAAYTRYLACVASEKVPAIRELLTRADNYRRGRSDFSAHAGLYAVLKERERGMDSLLFAEPAPRFVPEAAETVFKGKTTVAPTLAEGYFTCPYRNFAERGLLLKEREEASVRPVDTGNFLHDVMRDLALHIGELQGEAECAAYLRERSEKLLSEPPYCYLKDTLTGGWSAESLVRETVIVGLNVAEQLKNSEFTVFGAEKTFGYPDSPFQSVLLTSDEKPVRLAGKIDRVDACGEYMRVVDYKTGSFDVSAKSYYSGRKLQLELYLYAASRGRKMAGAYYFPARVSFGEDRDSPFRMQGFTVGDDSVVAMSEKGIERGQKSRYIDAYFGKKSKKALSGEDFEDFMEYSVLVARNFVKETRAGCIAASPYAGACDYCPYGGLCGHFGAGREVKSLDFADIADIVKRRKGE